MSFIILTRAIGSTMQHDPDPDERCRASVTIQPRTAEELVSQILLDPEGDGDGGSKIEFRDITSSAHGYFLHFDDSHRGREAAGNGRVPDSERGDHREQRRGKRGGGGALPRRE